MRTMASHPASMPLGRLALATLILPVSVCAQAQDATEATPEVQDRFVHEITVTARRREENLYDVPVAVTAIGGADLEARGIQVVSETFGEIPSLFFTTAGAPIHDASTSFLVMRGVGATYVADPAVGIFVDGIYQPTISFGQEILAVDRVEVLRGPQGTQFGRNTQGGAVNFVTRRPSRVWEGRVAAELDELSTLNASLYASGPLSGSLAGNFAASASSSDGYVHNTFTGKDQTRNRGGKARAGLQWGEPGGVRAYATAFYEERRGPGMSLGVLQGCECYDVELDVDRDNEFESYGASLEVTIPIGDLTLQSLTGYSRADADAVEDVDGTALFRGNIDRTIQTQRFASQEFRLQSPTEGAFDWMAGLYFEDSRRALTVDRQWPDFIGYVDFLDDTVIFATGSVDTTAYAVYGEINYAFGSGWELDVGGRYAREEAQRDGHGFINIPPLGGIVASAESQRARVDYSTFTPRIALSYRPSSDTIIYGSFATGFKAGGFSAFPGLNQLDDAFEAEKSLAYEIGTKALLLDGTLSLAAALFYTEIKDQQVEVTVLIDGLPRSVFDNAAESESRGVELEASWRIGNNWRLKASGSYTDARYKRYINANGVDLSDTPFPFVPEWLASASLDYRRLIGDGVTFTGELSGRYIGRQRSNPATLPDADNIYLPVPSSTVLDARIGIETDRMRMFAFVRNLTDRYYITHAAYAKFTQGLPPYNERAYEQPGSPRVVGLRFEWSL